MTAQTTQCCISGGGPAGIMLGFLLARSGIDVIVLEKWPDFFRDFRGDTIHPSTLELLDELGLLEQFLALPHNETKQVSANIGGKKIIIADFTKLKTVCRFLAFVPQWDFLNFIAREAQKYPGFHLLMETEATDLMEENGTIVGVHARNKAEQFEIRSPLVVGADGRHSTVREKSHLSVTDEQVPIDVLWFRLPRKDDGTAESLGYVNHGAMMVLIDRDSYWQCAFVIRKGDFDQIKTLGLDAFRRKIAALVPTIAASVSDITDWEKVKLLAVSVDHLKQWYRPGLVCIGDAAHAMSPVGGVGINLAIQDAVAAANILIPTFKSGNGAIPLSTLAAIQQRRAQPARIIQRVQRFLHRHIFQGAIENTRITNVPWQLRLINAIPYLRRIPAYLVGVGFRPEHIETKQYID